MDYDPSDYYPLAQIVAGQPPFWYTACPVCGSRNQSIAQVRTTEPVTSGENLGPVTTQGQMLHIVFRGEDCGSEWSISFGFHKGETLHSVVVSESCKKPSALVYFIEAVGLARVKIGYSDNPEKRLAQLSTGSPVELRIMRTVAGGQELEKQLHAKFDHLRIDGEWFHLTKELQVFIAQK